MKTSVMWFVAFVLSQGALFAENLRPADGTHVFAGQASDGVQVPVSEAESFTASVWLKAETPGDGENRSPRVFQLPQGNLHLVANTSATNMADLVFEFVVPTNVVPRGFVSWRFPATVPLRTWAHLAFVCAPDFAPALYVNGRRFPRASSVRPMPRPFPGGKFCLGNTFPGGKRPLTGELADFRFSPRAFSSSEIAALAACGPDGKPPSDVRPSYDDKMPIRDISRDASRQAVVASGADGEYQGHPTTLLTPGGDLFCVWTINHGGFCGPMAKSSDGGRTWKRLDATLPDLYRKHKNCPVLQTVPRPDGGVNFCIYSANRDPENKGGLGILVSSDLGETWRVAPPQKHLSAGMPPTGFMPLKDGAVALFGQVFKSSARAKDRPEDDQAVWMSVSRDGGLTWGAPRIVASVPEKNLCEPFAIRSPDGSEIALLLRENRHKGRSMVAFSKNEGRTWTRPVDTCWGLSGDRHEGVVLPDGRLFIAFRDRAIGSSTYGQYVAWVGTYEDLRTGRPGAFRVHLLDHVGENAWDTGYSGVELLPDGDVLCTTYLQYRQTDAAHSVVCTRVRAADLVPAPAK